MLPGLAHGLGGDAESQAGIDREIEAPVLEPRRLHARRLAELDHVGEQRLLHLAADALELGLAFRGFDEDDVGAGLLVEAGAAPRPTAARRRAGVRCGPQPGAQAAR